MSRLSNKQRVFIDEYLTDFNATRAAIRAGYSSRTASVIGHENLRKPYLTEIIKARLAEKTLTADEVLSRLAEHARGDMGGFLDIDSMAFQIDLTKAKELGITRLIKKVRQHTTTVISKDGTESETTSIELE